MNKEAVIVILDCNPTMTKVFSSDKGQSGKTRFQLGIESIRMLLEQKLLYSPSHDFGMVLFGTSDSSNALNDKYAGEYENVSTVRTLTKIDLDLVRRLESFTAEDD